MELSKRSFLKASGATTTAALAGCLGGGSDGRTFWAGWWDDNHFAEFRDWYEGEIENETEQEWELTEYQYDDLQSNVITGANTGTPDLIEGVIEHPGDYVAADILEPLTDHAREFDHYDGFLDSALEAFNFNGEQWALPAVGGNGRALVYRTDILANYGYEDGPPTDAEEFIELAAEINENEDDMNGLHMTTERGEVRVTQEFLSHVYQHVEGLYTEVDENGWELNADADIFEAVLDTFYYNLFLGDNPTADDSYRGSGWETNDEGYSMGDHAMIHCGPWIRVNDDTEEQKEIIVENTGIAPLPRHEGAEHRTFLEVSPVMINQHTDDLEATLTALEIFTSPEGMERMAEHDPSPLISTHEEVDSTFEEEAYEPFEEAFENGVAPAPIQWGEVREPIYDAVEEVIYGETDPATAAEELESALSEADVTIEDSEE